MIALPERTRGPLSATRSRAPESAPASKSVHSAPELHICCGRGSRNRNSGERSGERGNNPPAQTQDGSFQISTEVRGSLRVCADFGGQAISARASTGLPMDRPDLQPEHPDQSANRVGENGECGAAPAPSRVASRASANRPQCTTPLQCLKKRVDTRLVD